MNKTYVSLIAGLALAMFLCGPSTAQIDLLGGSNSESSLQTSISVPDATNDQSWVREFNGRNSTRVGIDSVESYGYDKDNQYSFGARNILLGDEELDFKLGFRNAFTVRTSVDFMTHRFFRTPAVNPWLSSQLGSLATPPAAMVIGRNWDSMLDLSPGVNFSIDRRVYDYGITANPYPDQKLSLVADWWTEMENGQRQLLFRSREKSGAVLSGTRESIALPVNRRTSESSLGFDWAPIHGTVVNFRSVNSAFRDGRTGFGDPGTSLNFSPLNVLTKFNSDTKSQVIKARSNIAQNLDFAGVHISKRRDNNSNSVPVGLASAGSALNKKVDINSTNLALIYRAIDNLSITAKYRSLNYENKVPPIYTLVAGVPAATPDNQQLSEKTTSFEIDGAYTGLRRTFVRAGFEQRDESRDTSPLHPAHDEFEHPFTGSSTRWNIWRSSVRYNPMTQLHVAANVESWKANNATFVGTPDDRKKTNINATYLLRDNVGLFADFSRWDDKNTEIREDASVVATPATTPAQMEERSALVGQGTRSKLTTQNIGVWFAMNDKLTLDANYGKSDINAITTWVIGEDPAYVPHLVPALTPFKTESKQTSLGLNYAFANKHRVFGRIMRVDSDGANYVVSANFLGLGPKWTPFEVLDHRWQVGYAYQVSAKDALSLDFSVGRWEDKIDTSQDGRYSIWHCAWSRSY